MASDTTRRESELRQATVLFADISGFTSMSEKMRPEEVTTIMNDCFGIMGNIIEHFGGRIDKYIGDCVMATFGVPTAIENAPLKAVNTAIEMRNKVYQFNKKNKLPIPIDIHIGINSGNVLAGVIGAQQKQEYTVMGDTVNLASRLEDVSQTGQILVGPTTFQNTKNEFEYKALKPVRFKGKEKPVPVFELVSKKKKVHRRFSSDRLIHSKMVGREIALDKLELAVLKAKNGEGSIVNVIGEAGIGKSRLIAELQTREARQGCTFLEGRAISMGRNLSFYPIIEILKSFAGIVEDDTEIEQLRKLESAIKDVHPAQLGEILPFTATLMGIQLSGKYAERIKSIDSEGLDKIIFKNLRELILRSAEVSPLIFVLEDMHWADTSSLELLVSLFSLVENSRILFINVFRPHYPETGENIQEAVKEKYSPLYTEIYLDHLDMEQSDLLIDNLLKIKGLPPNMKDLIKERSEGNPFFIEEVVRSMIDEGAVELKDGNFSITRKIDQVIIPNTIQELLMSRIDRLEEKTKTLIKNASVIGRHFLYNILTAVSDTIEDIDGKLAYLKEVQLIREGQRMEEVEYLFKHALAHETTYESILFQKRKELHCRVAESFEMIFTERLHEVYGMLAYHYSQGGDMNKVEEYMFKAGEEAIKSSATSEAIGYYQKALELYVTKYGADVDSLKIARMEAKICKALSARGKLVDAINYGDRALQRMGIWEPDNRFYQAIYLTKSLLIILKHNYLSSKRALKTPTEDDIQIVDTIIARANALTIVDAKRLMVVGLPNLARYCNYDISKSQVFFRFGVGAGIFFFAIGFFKIGKRMLDNLRNEISDDNEEISPYLYFHQFAVAAHDIISGQLKCEVDWKVVDQALAVSDYFYATSYLSFFGWHYIEVGDFELVEKIIGRLDKNSIEYNDDHARMDIYEMSAILSITRHEIDMARKFIKLGLKLTDQLDQQVRKVTHLGLKLQIQIKTDDLESARKTKTEAEYMIDKIGKVTILPFFYSRYAVGAVLYNLTQLENAIISKDKKGFSGYRKDTLKAAKEAVKTGYRFAPIITESLRYMAIYYWLINKQKKALKWFTRSIKEGERLGARPDLSRTYMEVGKRLLEPKSRYRQLNGIAAADYLEKARGLFEAMDLWWDLEQLDKLKTTI